MRLIMERLPIIGRTWLGHGRHANLWQYTSADPWGWLDWQSPGCWRCVRNGHVYVESTALRAFHAADKADWPTEE